VIARAEPKKSADADCQKSGLRKRHVDVEDAPVLTELINRAK
jgi:hypothetical protein